MRDHYIIQALRLKQTFNDHQNYTNFVQVYKNENVKLTSNNKRYHK